MSRAAVLSQWRPPYNGDRFASGLRALGYQVSDKADPRPTAGDVLVIWNRLGFFEPAAVRYEAAGAHVIVVENGYLGRQWRGSTWYAMARGEHNGCGTWPAADPQRWQSFGIDLPPWDTQGHEIVILAQRGIGSGAVRQPQGWSESARRWLIKTTSRPIRVRSHPGSQKAKPPVTLERDLSNAWAVVTWGSSAGLSAITLGIPVFHGLAGWIGATAARPFGHDIEDPFRGDPAPMFHRLATAMWSVEEIESGEAFRKLLA